MTSKLKPGAKVSWDSAQGKIHGTVEREVTAATKVAGHTARATPEEPQYEVVSDRTGAHAIHRPEALRKG